MESGINDDTVRSIAELIPPRGTSSDETDFQLNIEYELQRRGLPPSLARVDSQVPESIVAKRRVSRLYELQL